MNNLTLTTPPPDVTVADYDAIEEAVMETARGRWFLLEYARRQRAAETQRLADAVDRLEVVIAGMAPQAPAPPAEAEERRPLDETAAAVAERLSDIVWTMRERGVGDQFCAELEKQIRIIRTLRVEMESARPQGDPDPLLLSLPLKTETPRPALPLELPPPWRPTQAPPEQKDAPPAPDSRLAALARLDGLPLMDRIALFC